METAAFIPIKEHSSRIPNKNFRDFNGKPLYEHFFTKLHPTNPFDSVYVNTVQSEDNDSVFTVSTHNSFFWNDDSPINYDPTELPRTQDLETLFEETTGLYAIERDSLLDRECRIGYDPEYVKVGDIEAIDIDEMSDLQLARLVSRNDLIEEKYSLSESYN